MAKTQGFILILLFLAGSLTWGQYQASIQEFAGKVEIRADAKSAWVPVTVGTVIKPGTTISVGLKSTAILALGNTRVTVKALTRLTLQEIVEKQDSVSTGLFLSAGRVAADVQPIKGKNQTFKVQSPVATASVRGTSFEFDGSRLFVERGRVDMSNQTGFMVPVRAGQSSVANPEQPAAAPASPKAELIQSVLVQTDLAAGLAPQAASMENAGLVVDLPDLGSQLDLIDQVAEEAVFADLVITIGN